MSRDKNKQDMQTSVSTESIILDRSQVNEIVSRLIAILKGDDLPEGMLQQVRTSVMIEKLEETDKVKTIRVRSFPQGRIKVTYTNLEGKETTGEILKGDSIGGNQLEIKPGTKVVAILDGNEKEKWSYEQTK